MFGPVPVSGLWALGMRSLKKMDLGYSELGGNLLVRATQRALSWLTDRSCSWLSRPAVRWFAGGFRCC